MAGLRGHWLEEELSPKDSPGGGGGASPGGEEEEEEEVDLHC